MEWGVVLRDLRYTPVRVATAVFVGFCCANMSLLQT